LDELVGAFAYVLPRAARVRIRHRAFTFFITRMPKDRPLDRTPLRPSMRDSACLLSVAAAHLGLLLLFQLVPPHAAALSLERLDDRTRYLSIELAHALPPPTPQTAVDPGVPSLPNRSAAPNHGEVTPAPGTVGPAPRKHTPAGSNAPDVMQKPSADEVRAGVGVIGTLREFAGQLGQASPRLGRDRATGSNPEDALRELLRDGIASNGPWGRLGMLGPGRGSGGDGGGGPIVGRIGTHPGFTEGPGYAAGLPIRRSPKITVPTLRPGSAVVRGSLSREAIQRVIRRELPGIRYCYQQGLLGRPDLEGRVTLKFIIGGAGVVQTAVIAQSSLGDPRVEVCIAQAAKRWTFTAPEGGGIVIVNYPFTFQRPGP
jgi:TonB family protein